VLQIDRLSKSFGSRPVLQELSLQIMAGEVYALLGANGAGKTTTINIICNLLKADSGQVLINDLPASERTKPLIGIAPQQNLLYGLLSCTENLRFFGQIYGLRGEQLQQRVAACLAAVHLSDRADAPIETLSGGMQRRMNLAVALVHQPKLVILDEPTTGLDLEARYEVWELIRQLQRQGMTILLTTHLLDEAEQLASRIGILKQGQLIVEGSLKQLQQRIPAQEIVLVQTPEPRRAIERARQHGFRPRKYGGDLAFWLPKTLELKEILERFDGIPIDSVARQPVRLEHIYIEFTQNLKKSARN
jgi:ABC-2 type transport system ATP-binding protein